MNREEMAQFCIDHPYRTPAFQFYSNDWWGSRHIAAMTPEERGIHASLIFSAWLESNCGIPENEFCLSARISDDKKPIGLRVLSWCWFLYNGFWFCERLLKERIKQIELSNKRQLSGSKGGRPTKSRIKRIKPIDNQLDSKHKAKITKSEEENEIEKEDEKEDINNFQKEGIKGEKEKIYSLYPTKDSNNNGRSTGKSLKDKEKIYAILKEKKYPLTEAVDLYVRHCRKSHEWLRNLSVFLNNLPGEDMLETWRNELHPQHEKPPPPGPTKPETPEEKAAAEEAIRVFHEQTQKILNHTAIKT